MAVERRKYTKTVETRNWENYDLGGTRRRKYHVTVERDVPTDWTPLFRLIWRLGKMSFYLTRALIVWFIAANRSAPSYDRQLWLSSCRQSWVTMYEHVRNGVPRYKLWITSPGDFAWNLVGEYTEWPLAETAKNQWVQYTERGGTYQTWLSQQADGVFP